MPTAQENSSLKIEKLEPRFAEKIKLLIKNAKQQGYDVGVVSGYRSIEEQNKLYKQGRSEHGKIVTNARGGHSWHNYGVAADVVFIENGGFTWDDKLPWFKLGQLGKSIGLEWGGDWKNIIDRPHFQLTGGVSLGKALTLVKEGGLENVWKTIYKGD